MPSLHGVQSCPPEIIAFDGVPNPNDATYEKWVVSTSFAGDQASPDKSAPGPMTVVNDNTSVPSGRTYSRCTRSPSGSTARYAMRSPSPKVDQTGWSLFIVSS